MHFNQIVLRSFTKMTFVAGIVKFKGFAFFYTIFFIIFFFIGLFEKTKYQILTEKIEEFKFEKEKRLENIKLKLDKL